MIDWPIAVLFVLGGVGGGILGVALGRILARRKRALNLVFATIVVAAGIYVLARGISALSGGLINPA